LSGNFARLNMSMSDIIIVKNLQKSYGDHVVVKGISFSVKKGEVFGILGPNGAGKTSTLEMLEALRPMDSGSVTLAGLNVSKEPQHVKEVIGVQLQSTGFYDNLTLRELLVMFSGLYHQSINADELLADVNLTEKAKAHVKTLSGGQKQRFSIASALVNKPKVLFLDEPTTGLDPQARRNLWELVQNIKKKGITVVLTTHYMEEAELLCDRVAIMDEGQIIALDAPSKLVKDLLKKGFKKKTEVQPATLEDVFIDMTGKELRD
jgi:ABC-2 type transport system ATP-binding protein